jgi:hypothetical protein
VALVDKATCSHYETVCMTQEAFSIAKPILPQKRDFPDIGVPALKGFSTTKHFLPSNLAAKVFDTIKLFCPRCGVLRPKKGFKPLELFLCSDLIEKELRTAKLLRANPIRKKFEPFERFWPPSDVPPQISPSKGRRAAYPPADPAAAVLEPRRGVRTTFPSGLTRSMASEMASEFRSPNASEECRPKKARFWQDEAGVA